MSSETIFQTSDLQKKRTEVVREARAGRAVIRDTDGTSLVFLRESRVALLEALANWNTAATQLTRLLSRGAKVPSVTDLGDLAWLRVFNIEEMHEFLDELQQALIAAHADGDVGPIEECVRAWRVTAQQLQDPLRESILRGKLISASDLVPAELPRERT